MLKEATEPSPIQMLPRYGNYSGLDCEGLLYERGHWRTSAHAVVKLASMGGRGEGTALPTPRKSSRVYGGGTAFELCTLDSLSCSRGRAPSFQPCVRA